MPNLMIVSGLSRKYIFAWMLAAFLVLSSAIFKEINGSGLRSSIYFHSLGYFIYPIFYGSCLYVIYRMLILTKNLDNYIRICDDSLFIGENGPLHKSEIINIEIDKQSIIQKVIIIHLIDARSIKIKLYILNRNLEYVLPILKKWLSS